MIKVIITFFLSTLFLSCKTDDEQIEKIIKSEIRKELIVHLDNPSSLGSIEIVRVDKIKTSDIIIERLLEYDQDNLIADKGNFAITDLKSNIQSLEIYRKMKLAWNETYNQKEYELETEKAVKEDIEKVLKTIKGDLYLEEEANRLKTLIIDSTKHNRVDHLEIEFTYGAKNKLGALVKSEAKALMSYGDHPENSIEKTYRKVYQIKKK